MLAGRSKKYACPSPSFLHSYLSSTCKLNRCFPSSFSSGIEQEGRDQLITKKLLETPVDYAALSGYYKKDTAPPPLPSSAKESAKNKKHRNKKPNKPNVTSSNVNFSKPPPPQVVGPPLSAEELELQSILSQIEEVEKKQVHKISFNRDFPVISPLTSP